MLCHKIRINELKSCCIFLLLLFIYLRGELSLCALSLRLFSSFFTGAHLFSRLWPKRYQGKYRLYLYFFYIFSLYHTLTCACLCPGPSFWFYQPDRSRASPEAVHSLCFPPQETTASRFPQHPERAGHLVDPWIAWFLFPGERCPRASPFSSSPHAKHLPLATWW